MEKLLGSNNTFIVVFILTIFISSNALPSGLDIISSEELERSLDLKESHLEKRFFNWNKHWEFKKQVFNNLFNAITGNQPPPPPPPPRPPPPPPTTKRTTTTTTTTTTTKKPTTTTTKPSTTAKKGTKPTTTRTTTTTTTTTTTRTTTTTPPPKELPSRKRKLRPNWADDQIPVQNCGDAFNIAVDGYVTFLLSSKHQSCYHAFIGSRALECTVAIYCDGSLKLKHPSSKGCTEEYLGISDGTSGEMVGCGDFTFDNKPRIPRNHGKDLYVTYKGISPDAPCVAYCKEDLEQAKTHPHLKPTVLEDSSTFNGFPLAEGCQCGKRRDFGRIVSGDDALPFEFPWMAGLMIPVWSENKRVPYCGATLVSDTHAITAAHCVLNLPSNYKFQILLHAHIMDKRPGRWNFTEITPGWDLPVETDESEESIRIDVESIVGHPLFDEDTYDYDIAILTLKRRVNFQSKKASPICLPYMSELMDPKKGDNYVFAGWGQAASQVAPLSRILQKLDLPYIAQEDCEKYSFGTYNQFCAGFIEGGKSSCKGDSGGPLIKKIDENTNQYAFVGIDSFAMVCAGPYSPTGYTNIMEVLPWIYHQLANSGANLCAR